MPVPVPVQRQVCTRAGCTRRPRTHALTHSHEQMAPETARRVCSGQGRNHSFQWLLPARDSPLRPARPRRPPQSAYSQPVSPRLAPGSAHLCISPRARLA